MKLPKDRIPYSAIVDRPPLKLPDGARIAVWTIVNVEEWSIERNMPRTVLPPPYGQPLLPDLPNWAWHEYGMRVGFWRFVEVLKKFNVKATLAINGSVVQDLSARGEGGARGGLGVHGPRLHPAADAPRGGPARGDPATPIEAIKAFTGQAAARLGEPGAHRNLRDDRLPRGGRHRVRRRLGARRPAVPDRDRVSGPIVSVPYTVEMNDIAMMALQHHPVEEWLRRGIDHFDRLYAEGEKSARVMAISVHPYITGVPHRIGYLERLYEYILQRPGVKIWTGEQILDWYQHAAKP